MGAFFCGANWLVQRGLFGREPPAEPENEEQ
jgi:hypothetical protein